MKTPGLICKTLLAAAIGLPMTAANATVIDFYNGSDLYAQLTTSGGTSFSMYFVGTGAQSGAFVNDLYMAGPATGGTFNNTTAGSVTTPTGAFGSWNASGGGGGAAVYNWDIAFPTANDASRFTIGETATWDITPTAIGAWTLDMVHLNAAVIDPLTGKATSIKLDGCIDGSAGCGGGGGVVTTVPEPGSLVLAGLALLGVGVARRRRA